MKWKENHHQQKNQIPIFPIQPACCGMNEIYSSTCCGLFKELTEHSVSWALEKLQSQRIDKPEIAVLVEGSYGIPLCRMRRM
jgi:hypothetical protein